MKEARRRPISRGWTKTAFYCRANVLKVLRRPQAPPRGTIGPASETSQKQSKARNEAASAAVHVASTDPSDRPMKLRRDDTLKSITRPAYGGFQLLLLLRPTGLFGARPFVQRGARLLDARGPGVVLAFSFFKRSFRARDCLFAPTAFLLSRHFFLAPRHFAPFLLSLKSDCGGARSFRMDVAWRQIFRLRASFCWLVLDRVARQRLRQVGVLAERLIRPDRAPQNEFPALPWRRQRSRGRTSPWQALV